MYSFHYRLAKNARVRLGVLGLGVLLLASSASAVGTRHFVIQNADEFEAGELSGVAVDSLGRLSPGLDLGAIEVSAVDAVWSVHHDDTGLYLATGNQGKLVRVAQGKATTIASYPTMALTSVTEAFGKIMVATLPGGKVLELKGDKLETFVDLGKETHIWALSYDARAKALYAATGPSGKLYRITQDGTAQVYFDAEESHLVSVLADGERVFAGSSGEGRLYEIAAPGRAKVVYDFGVTEVRSIVTAKNGDVYVIANELKSGGGTKNIDKAKPGEPNSRDSKGGTGTLFRFSDAGPEQLFADKSEHFISLTLDAAGLPVVGTGEKGRLIRVGQEHNRTILSDVEERQISGAVFLKDGGWVIASDPVVAHPIVATFGKNATWTSDVLDCGIRARFGRPSWDQTGKVAVEARSGNTKKPDNSWSNWSSSLASSKPVDVPQGRFLQLRVRLLSADATLERINVPYVTDNLRAVVTAIEAKTGAVTEGSTGISASGSPVDNKSSSKVKLSWSVDNPDDDQLRYRVEYRPKSGGDWVSALEPGAVHQTKNFEWNTADLPEGQYVVRVTASDELSNPPARVQRHMHISNPILVDNTSPKFSGVVATAGRVSGTVVDGIGPIQRLELKVAGQVEWVPFEPEDGIFDQKTEKFSFDYSGLDLKPGSLLTIRVYDTAGNFEVAHVRVPETRAAGAR